MELGGVKTRRWVTILRKPLSTRSAMPYAWSDPIVSSSHARYERCSGASSRCAYTRTLTSIRSIGAVDHVEQRGSAIEIDSGTRSSTADRRETNTAPSTADRLTGNRRANGILDQGGERPTG